ncbi:uncharacterized protein LY89DRAFT_123864 [Mollisia scopiformis]|uniref:Uncharacterized protein n=1 Tax=Mollisia scopiformis TaxID=149040 RepID=A0A194X4W0_MOLSC|nr:uncharacterized protein LY89DRAFT_123864 [Mollisia scopiformis]KUJ14847.1 hypothetical protein LY89DRAFT_123864 [Mollisia scopiformis]
MSALYSIVDSFMARADWRDMATLSAVKTGSGYNELTSLLHATTITNVQDLSRPLGHMPSIASEYLSKVLAAEISLTSKIKNMGSRTTMRTKTKRQDTDPDYPYTEESSYSSMVAQIHDEANDNVDYLSSIIGDQVSIELSSMIATMLPEDQEYLSSIIGDQISIELSSMIATMLPEDQDYLSSIIGDQASIESIISANFANSSASKANKQVVNTKASAIASPTSKKNSAPSKGVLGTGALAICLIGVMVLL